MSAGRKFDIIEISRTKLGRAKDAQSAHLARLANLRREVQLGSYKVDSNKVAGSIVRTLETLEMTLQSVA